MSVRAGRTGRIVAVIAVEIGMCVLASSLSSERAGAATLAADNGRAAEIAQIRAIVPRNFPPYYLTDDAGRPTGFAVELMDLIANELGVSVRYVVAPDWQRAMDALLEGRGDLIPNVGMTQERKELLFGTPYDLFPICMFVRDSSKQLDSIEDFAQRPVAVVQSNAAGPLLQTQPEVIIQEYDDLPQALFALLSGQVDGLAYPKPVLEWYLRESHLDNRVVALETPLVEIQRSVALRKDDTDLLAAINPVLERLGSNPEYRVLYQKWFAAGPPFWTATRVFWTMAVSGIMAVLLTATFGYARLFSNIRDLRQALIDRDIAQQHVQNLSRFPEEDPNPVLRITASGIVTYANAASAGVLTVFRFQVGDTAPRILLETALDALRAGRAQELDARLGAARMAFVFAPVPESGYVNVYGHDITARVEAEERTRTRERQLRQVIDLVPHLIFAKDREGRFILANKSASDSLGVGVDEIVGRRQEEFALSRDQIETFKEQDRAVIESQTGQVIAEEEFTDVHGRTRVFQTTKQPFFADEQTEPAALAIAVDITDLKRAQTMLRVSRQNFHNLIQRSFDAILVADSGNTIIFANRAAEALFGKSAEALFGSKIDFPTMDSQSKDIHVVRPDGSVRLAELKTVRTEWEEQLAYFYTLRDVTEQRRTAEERARLARAIEQTADGIAILDAKRVIVYTNPAFEEMAGRDRDALIGEDFTVIEDELIGGASVLAQIRSSIDAGDGWQGVISETRTGHKSFEFEATFSPIRNDDRQIASYLLVLRDVTHEREMEAQIRQSQKLQAIGTLAGGIAHDFNNILAAIIGYSEFVQSDLPEGKSQQDIQEVIKAAYRARELVQKILTFSRRTEHRKELVALDQVLKEAYKLLRATLPSTIAITQHFGEGPWLVHADASQMHQVVMNLCTNAYHAMEDAGGILEIRLESAELPRGITPESMSDQFMCLSISDTGIGMSPDVVERVFEPFFTTKPVGKGTGMGLATVHGIVETHGGAITVDSELGAGTTFHVYLPRAARVQPRPALRETVHTSGNGEHILLVDDEETIVDVASRLLERIGYRVTSFTSSIAALEAFRVDPDSYDLILTDLTMPDMTGAKLAEEARRLRPEMPVIIASGYNEFAQPEFRSDDFKGQLLAKPFVAADLSTAIRIELERHEFGDETR